MGKEKKSVRSKKYLLFLFVLLGWQGESKASDTSPLTMDREELALTRIGMLLHDGLGDRFHALSAEADIIFDSIPDGKEVSGKGVTHLLRQQGIDLMEQAIQESLPPTLQQYHAAILQEVKKRKKEAIRARNSFESVRLGSLEKEMGKKLDYGPFQKQKVSLFWSQGSSWKDDPSKREEFKKKCLYLWPGKWL